MISTPLGQRERLLSLWVRNRLGEEETIKWAITALKQIPGELGTNTVGLFDSLNDQAQASTEISPATKKVWSLLNTVAKESAHREALFVIHETRQRIKDGSLRAEHIDQLIDSFRPRLKASEPSPRVTTDEGVTDDPLRWVRWSFESLIRPADGSSSALTQSGLKRIPSDLLNRLVEKGTSALKDALLLARDIGWIGADRDFPNSLVRRVFSPGIAASEQKSGSEDRDLDDLNDDFVPLVRLLSTSLDLLAGKSIEAAANIAETWRKEFGGLFLRLFAFAAWNPKLVSGWKVAAFLENIDDHSFWRWLAFPEIASLRAIRWDALPKAIRSKIEGRLLAGPSNLAFRTTEAIPEATIKYHRDHELARLVDAGLDVPNEFRRLVEARRADDTAFPSKVFKIEYGLPGARAIFLPKGDSDRFSEVPNEKLLAALAEPRKEFLFNRGSDAEAFARTANGKRRILDTLDITNEDDSNSELAWQLLLSGPQEKSDDTNSDREIAQRTAQIALNLPSELFQRLAGNLCYWLDYADSYVPNFECADQLWLALLPHAAAKANKEEEKVDAATTIDLTMAALNEPLGHLLSMYLRRCPTIPDTKAERPQLPANFTNALKTLSGRAKELLVNHIATSLNYFSYVDKSWANEAVIEPMTKDDQVSERIWEAFGKYGRVAPPDVWARLQPFHFRRLGSMKLSPEAKRRLTEMCVVIWAWSKDPKSRYMIDVANFRLALGLSGDDVRRSAAWQFSLFFRGKRDDESDDRQHPGRLWRRLGPKFFEDVWPLEPTLQSGGTAHNFARIPAEVGSEEFANAVSTVLPYLMPFEVWAVLTEFGFDPEKSETEKIILNHSEQMLTLLAACISEQQRHGVYDLKKILDHIASANPALARDRRMRILQKMAT
jgi:hypothetical protein